MNSNATRTTSKSEPNAINYLTVDGFLDSKKEESINERFFEFKPKENDYFYACKVSWNVITADIFHVKIGKQVFGIPSTFYVLIGDSYGDIDWIQIDELIGREIECVILDKSLESWSLDQPSLVDMTTETFHWPMTSNIVPSVSGENAILISNKDQHFGTKGFLIDSFITSM